MQTILEQTPMLSEKVSYYGGEWKLVVNLQPMYDGTETFYDITDSFKMEIQL